MPESVENRDLCDPSRECSANPAAPLRPRRAALWLGLLVSGGILAWLALNLDWPAFLREFRRVRIAPILLVVLLTYLSLWIRAIRWRHLLPSHAELSRRRLFDATAVGFTANLVLPLRAGEIVRPWVLARWQPVGFATGFASIVVERVFDAFVLIGLLGLSLSRIEEIPPFVRSGAMVLAAVALVILALMIYAYFHSDGIVRLAKWFLDATVGRAKPAFAEKLLAMTREFTEGLRGISSFRELALVLFWSLVLWLEISLIYHVGLLAFGVAEPDPWIGLTVNVMIAVAIAAPGAPGFLGTFQIGCIVALAIYGYTREFALAYSVVLHAAEVVPTVLLGLVILHRRGLAFRDIQARAHVNPDRSGRLGRISNRHRMTSRTARRYGRIIPSAKSRLVMRTRKILLGGRTKSKEQIHATEPSMTTTLSYIFTA